MEWQNVHVCTCYNKIRLFTKGKQRDPVCTFTFPLRSLHCNFGFQGHRTRPNTKLNVILSDSLTKCQFVTSRREREYPCIADGNFITETNSAVLDEVCFHIFFCWFLLCTHERIVSTFGHSLSTRLGKISSITYRSRNRWVDTFVGNIDHFLREHARLFGLFTFETRVDVINI